MKMTYNDIFFQNQILVNIPTRLGERSLSAATATSLLLMRVAFQSKMEEYESICRMLLDDIKKDDKFSGFDEKAMAHEEAARILAMKKAHDEWSGAEDSRPACPSADEISKAETTMASSAEYEKVLSELTNAYGEARAKQAEVETNIEFSKLTRAELEDIVGVIGTQDALHVKTLNGEFDEPSQSFLALIAKLFA